MCLGFRVSLSVRLRMTWKPMWCECVGFVGLGIIRGPEYKLRAIRGFKHEVEPVNTR